MNGNSEAAGAFFIFVPLFLIGVAIYSTPTFIAIKRGHAQRNAIMWLNILTGWSFIGWVGALIWALTNPQVVSAKPVGSEKAYYPDSSLSQRQEKICPRCAESVKEAALICRYCNYAFPEQPAHQTVGSLPLGAHPDKEPRTGNHGTGGIVDGGKYRLIPYSVYADGQVVANNANGAPRTWRSLEGFRAWADDIMSQSR